MYTAACCTTRLTIQSLLLPCWCSRQLQDISLDGTVAEESVLRLIEVLEVPRHQAIDMLIQHEGDIEAAIVTFASL